MSALAEQRSMAVKRGITWGVVGGVAGAAVMAMYAMVVSATVKDVGFFTPLYHIASAFIAPKAMLASMAKAAAGDATYVAVGPAVVGVVVHMMTGAIAGAVFGAGAAWRPLSRPVTVVAGGVFGLLVMVVNGYVGLPIVASLFGGGKPISDMPTMVGWGTFTVEHLLFGLVLGLVVAAKAAGSAVALRRPLATHPA
jgi:hypothetical protein